jgi:predicted LPLAT superfamily acyltransferase
MGDIKVADLEIHNQAELDRVIDDKQGVLVIASHLGNIEICRALSDRHGQVKMTVFAHTKHAVHFNALLAQYNPKAAIDVVEVDDMGPATAVDLQERLAGGEWVVIAGDRTPVSGQKRRSLLPFLGQEAPFSQGPILLAHLLQCPVYAMTCLRDGKRFQVHFDRLFDQVSLGRTNRAASIEAYQGQYVALLEGYAKQYPLQWFNFFDFWEECA